MGVTLNVDAGELENEPEELIAIAQRIHVACGGHVGDAVSMRRTLEVAKRHGVEVGAHPSYVDREGFGRRRLAVSPDVLGAQVAAQCRALKAIGQELGVAIVGAKAHGALYHDTLRDRQLAGAVLHAIVSELGAAVQIVTQPGTLLDLSRTRGITVLREGYADRGIGEGGRLIPRGEHGAMIDDPAKAAAQAVTLAASGQVETICVHGDGPNALAVARAVRRALSS